MQKGEQVVFSILWDISVVDYTMASSLHAKVCFCADTMSYSTVVRSVVQYSTSLSIVPSPML